tara:strand:- start:3366 stop:3890 length:525 start_codon:yes stop_codon:yes gene_type:complete
MYFLKKILKNKNLPFYGNKANEAYVNLFIFGQKETSDDNKKIIYGIIQEVGDGGACVASGIYRDNKYVHIEKGGKLTKFEIKNIPGFRFLNSKNKVFDLCLDNFDKILDFESGKQPFLNNRGIRVTFLTSYGVFSKEGQFEDFNNATFLGHTTTLFLNFIMAMNQNKVKDIIRE